MSASYISVDGVEDGFDFDARYTTSWCKVAYVVLGWEAERDEEGELVRCGDNVVAVMVGDDRKHVIDRGDLINLDEDDYCHTCGQVGCGHG